MQPWTVESCIPGGSVAKLSRVLSNHGRGNHPCPLCETAPLEDSVMGTCLWHGFQTLWKRLLHFRYTYFMFYYGAYGGKYAHNRGWYNEKAMPYRQAWVRSRSRCPRQKKSRNPNWNPDIHSKIQKSNLKSGYPIQKWFRILLKYSANIRIL